MDISQITDYLYVGAEPTASDVREIAACNVRLIISMRGEARPPKPFGRAPFTFLWLRSYDTFLTPIAAKHLVAGIEAARRAVAGGGRVLVYCQRGRHRSVIMAAAILIASGHSAEQAMHMLRTARECADPDTWYVRRQIEGFAKRWPALASRAGLAAGEP